MYSIFIHTLSKHSMYLLILYFLVHLWVTWAHSATNCPSVSLTVHMNHGPPLVS